MTKFIIVESDVSIVSGILSQELHAIWQHVLDLKFKL